MSRDPLDDLGGQLEECRLYDRHTDIVACYEYLAKMVTRIKADVKHFHRFPKLVHPTPQSQSDLTPDFLWTGSGKSLVGEIASVALEPKATAGVVKQLTNYLAATHWVDDQGGRHPLGNTDVLVLTPHQSLPVAEERLLSDAAIEQGNDANDRRPILVSFSYTSDAYVFVRSSDSANGQVNHFSGLRESLTSKSIRLTVEKFERFRVGGPFINDPIPPLYLAGYLVGRRLVGKGIDATASGLTASLQERYGRGSAKDVAKALDLLVAAEVLKSSSGRFVHRRSLPKHRETLDALVDRLSEVVARRAAHDSARDVASSAAVGSQSQGALF